MAVLVHNKPSAYLVPANTHWRLLERLEDMELAKTVLLTVIAISKRDIGLVYLAAGERTTKQFCPDVQL